MTKDGEWAICTKEPSDKPTRDGSGWMHRLKSAPAGNGRARVNGSTPSIAPVTRYVIRGVDGTPVAVHCRKALANGDKQMWWEQPDGRRGLDKMPPADLPLFGVDALGTPNGRMLIVTEGEKARDALHALGVLSVGTVAGAEVTPSLESLRPLVGFTVMLWPDNDPPGQRHMARIAQRLLSLDVQPAVLSWPDAPDKGDAYDFVEAGLGTVVLDDMCSNAVRTYADGSESVVQANATPSRRMTVHFMSDLTPEIVRWIWPGRVPLAKMTVLDGDPGLGKSAVTLDIAARVTLGLPMPDGTVGYLRTPAGVLVLTAEDELCDTVLPRLLAAGADLTRVSSIEEIANADGEMAMPAIPRDLDVLEAHILANDIRLMILDPLIAFLGDSQETNTWRDQDIRRALGPFAHMLTRTSCAAIMIRHLNKATGGNALYRGGGSIGIIGAARSGLLVAKDNEDDTGVRRVLVPTKANLSAPAPALAYHIEQVAGGSIRIAWEGATEHTAYGLLAEPLSEEDRGALGDAVTFLKSELYGNPVLAEEIKRRARAADISPRTLARARAKLGVLATRDHGQTGPWSLQLPILPGTRAAQKANDGD